MDQRQSGANNSNPIHMDFEFTGAPYTGRWSEAHRYDCELTELALMSDGDRGEQIERIKSKRGEAAATQINIDAQNKRREMIASGAIKVERPKAKPSNGYGNYRGGYNNASRPASTPPRATSGPIF